MLDKANHIITIYEIINKYKTIVLIGNNSKNKNKIKDFLNYFDKDIIEVDNKISLDNINKNNFDIVLIVQEDYTKLYSELLVSNYDFYILYFMIYDKVFFTDYFNIQKCQILNNISTNIQKYIQENDVEKILREQFLLRIYHYSLSGLDDKDKYKSIMINLYKQISDFYKEYANKINLKQPVKNKEVKKIAFIYERLSSISSYMDFTKIVIENIIDKDLEIYIYCINSFELGLYNPSVVNIFTKMGVKIIDTNLLIDDTNNITFYSRYNKAIKIREHIIDNQIDALIAHDYNIYNNFLFSTKSANKQIFWTDNHFYYDFNGITKRITQSFDAKTKQRSIYNFTFYILPLKQEFNYNMFIEQAKIIKDNYGDNKIILGSIGRLIKVNSDEYLYVLSKILEQSPNTIYLCCGEGEEKHIIQDKIKQLGIEDKFIFTGHINSNIYVNVIDIYLDTFPIRGGQSSIEFIMNKKLVLKHNLYTSEAYREYTLNLSKNFGFERNMFSADNNEDYIDLALCYINDREVRENIAEIYFDTYDKNMPSQITKEKFLSIID